MSEYERFNGFVRQRLDDLLFEDFWGHYIFNESDFHSAAYFYIRDFFRKQDRHRIYVRCEPHLAGMRPDIAVYEGGKPVYVLEFKVFTKPDHVDDDAILGDIEKLHRVIQRFDSVRWAFFLLLYDRDEQYTFSDARLRRRGFERLSVTAINARRKEGSGRRRIGYDDWRREWDRLRNLHAGHG